MRICRVVCHAQHSVSGTRARVITFLLVFPWMVTYLVLETSYYTQKEFKAFRSLEAYNQMVSRFIASIKGHIVANKFVVLAKVRHSQRMNDSLIPIWIITEREGMILSAHCLGCKAGLAEYCSHIASVLFYFEAWTKINGRLSCTQVKCTWLLPSYVKQVDYARVRDINFTSAKKMKLTMFHMIPFLMITNLILLLQKNCQKKSQPRQKRKWTSSSLN